MFIILNIIITVLAILKLHDMLSPRLKEMGIHLKDKIDSIKLAIKNKLGI